MMKRKLFLLAILMLLPIMSFAQKFKSGDITYKIVNGDAYIYDVNRSKEEITIVPTVQNQGVTYHVKGVFVKEGEADEMYQPVRYYKAKIKTLRFADGFSEVLNSVAYGIKTLETVILPRSISKIEDNAFSNCENLKNITIPENVSEIGAQAFMASGIRELIIPNSVTKIGASAFSFCSKLEEVVISSNVQTIDEGAFGFDEQLKKVVFTGEHLSEIKSSVFDLCGLESLVLPNSVRTIGRSAFSGCMKMTDIVLPDNVEFAIEKPDDTPFSSCFALKNLACHNGSIPAGIQNLVPKDCPFAQNKYQSAEIGFEKSLVASNKPTEYDEPAKIIESSDVDVAIPVVEKTIENTYAIIIGNKSKREDVSYGEHDADIFAEFCVKTLGIPEQNISIYKNATYAEMLKAVRLVQTIQKAYEGRIKLLFYYSGDAVYDGDSQTSYFVPSDADESIIEICYSLKKMLNDLTILGTERTFAFLDAGINVTGLDIKDNTVVFVAPQNQEKAIVYSEKFHGLLTYYILKALQKYKGDLTVAQLKENVQNGIGMQTKQQANAKFLFSPSESNWEKVIFP